MATERELYWLAKRRRTPTLIRWWRDLNSWRWPKEIPDPEDRNVPDNPRRNAAMTAIAKELGYRVICGKIGNDARRATSAAAGEKGGQR